DTFIRIGTAGKLSAPAHEAGVNGVICTGSVRDEGTTGQYIPYEYPAMADRHIVDALAKAAKARGYHFLEGIVHSKDAFYGQIDPEGLPNGEMLKMRWDMWKKSRVLASEMETAALFVISSIRDCRAGAILSFQSMRQSMEVALDALKDIIERDKQD
ncbi:MAG TPA: nucleoside phosphorylase, partial [Clostridiaceae bacterium]|nr:nucleoside phosphorylase [Clostridiaceae bacterium]